MNFTRNIITELFGLSSMVTLQSCRLERVCYFSRCQFVSIFHRINFNDSFKMLFVVECLR